MKFLILSALFSLIQPVPLQAQSKPKAQKEFLAELNKVLHKSRQQHSSYEGVMTIDSVFAISKEGILSVTVRYTTDSSFKRVRLAAPVGRIDTIRYDLYLILEYRDDIVSLSESEPGSEMLKEVSKGAWFHVGAPLPEDVVYMERLQRALNKL